MPDFQIEIRTRSLNFLRRRLGIELHEFEIEQRKRLRTVTNLIRKEARARGKQTALRTKKRLHRSVRTRVKKVGAGELEGLVFISPKQFWYRILQAASVVRARGRIGVVGYRRAYPFMRPAIEAKEDEAYKIMGDSFRVFVK